MNNPLLNELRKIRTPLVFDALERFNLRSRSEGYSDSSLRCMLPALGSLVGYVCTGKIKGKSAPEATEEMVSWKTLWESVQAAPRPSVMVVQDLDYPECRGCAWGDVAASIFKAVGCEGVITNGGVRDIDEVARLKFKLFASGPIVGHGYIRFVEVGKSVAVAGLTFQPGQLIHADQHGVLIIPPEAPLKDLIRKAREVAKSEAGIIQYCKKPGFKLARLCEQMETHQRKMGGHFEK